MDDYTRFKITHEKIIDVLLFEYDTLRQEELTSMTGVQAIGTLGVVSLITALGLIYQTGANALYLALPPIIVAFMLMYINQQWVIFYIARYLRVIEDRINEIAGVPLLFWESKVGSQFFEGRVLVRHPQTRKFVFNYYPLSAGAIFLGLILIQAISLQQSSLVIRQLWPDKPNLAYLWVLIHLVIAIFIAIARLFALPKFLDAIEAEVRQLLHPLDEIYDDENKSAKKTDDKASSFSIQLLNYYNNRAKNYDRLFITNFIGRRESRILSSLLLPSPMRALDFGCGTGRSLLILLQAKYIVSAYDPSPNMLAVAKAKVAQGGHHVDWLQSWGELDGKQWPLITCIGVLDYFADARTLIQDLREFLEPNGTLIVSCPNSQSPLGFLFGLISRFTFPVHPRSEQAMRLILTDLGFIVQEVRYAFPRISWLGLTIFIRAQVL